MRRARAPVSGCSLKSPGRRPLPACTRAWDGPRTCRRAASRARWTGRSGQSSSTWANGRPSRSAGGYRSRSPNPPNTPSTGWSGWSRGMSPKSNGTRALFRKGPRITCRWQPRRSWAASSWRFRKIHLRSFRPAIAAGSPRRAATPPCASATSSTRTRAASRGLKSRPSSRTRPARPSSRAASRRRPRRPRSSPRRFPRTRPPATTFSSPPSRPAENPPRRPSRSRSCR